MLVNYLKKNLNIIILNINFISIWNYFIMTDNYLHVYLHNSKNISKLFLLCKYNSYLNLDSLMDIKCEDICHFTNKYRFKVTYVFVSEYYNIRFFFTVFLKEYANLASISEYFNSAEYLERLVWDEFGVNFNLENKKINRRLLTDYGFKGHPLKKNFPLTGFYECVFFFEKLRIKNIPINLLQESRKFSFRNYVLSC